MKLYTALLATLRLWQAAVARGDGPATRYFTTAFHCLATGAGLEWSPEEWPFEEAL